MTNSSTIKKYIGFLDWKVLMPKGMGRSIGKKHQVLYAIVCLVLIYVVNNFTWPELAPDVSLHNRPMFGEVLIPAVTRMRWIEYHDISLIRDIYSTSPTWISFAAIIYPLRCIIAFARTVFSTSILDTCGGGIKCPATYCARNIYSCFLAGAKVTNFIVACLGTVFSLIRLIDLDMKDFPASLANNIAPQSLVGGGTALHADITTSLGAVFALPLFNQGSFCIKSFAAYLTGSGRSGLTTFTRAVFCFIQKACFDVKDLAARYTPDILTILGGHIITSIKKAAFGPEMELCYHNPKALLAANFWHKNSTIPFPLLRVAN